MALGLTTVAVGCSSDSSGCADGGDAACGATGGAGGGGGGTGGGTQAFGLSGGDSCFEVTAFDASTFIDGCMQGTLVSDAANPASPLIVPFNYDGTTKIVKLGTAGYFGQGFISNNQGTLLRENDPVDSQVTACMWHQKDTSMITLIADNMFIISVTEDQTMFNDACGTADITPPGGMCTSKWTWTMKKSAKLPPCNTP